MTFEKVKEIIVETISCDEDKITLDASLKDDLGIDSLDAMELSMALEENFSLTIDEEELQKFVTVRNIVEFLDKQNG
ncbi:MAG: acyl carrier protein [Lachnospiraceae bacterium]|nr:acyl carrier protein [Lachnospiraceae bacterium]